MEVTKKEMLNDAIKDSIRGIKNLEAGSVSRASAVEDASKLYKLHIEQTKADIEVEEKRRNLELKDKEIKSVLIGTALTVGFQFATNMVGQYLYGKRFYNGLKFEETGSVASSFVRGLVSKMTPGR